MRAFEVYLNRKRLCVAGIGDDGVLNTMVDHVVGNGRNELYLRVGGLISPTMEHVLWRNQRLKAGDEVRVKIIESASSDRPKERHRRDPKHSGPIRPVSTSAKASGISVKYTLCKPSSANRASQAPTSIPPA